MSDSNLRHTLAGRSLSHDGTHDVDLRDSGQWNVLYVVASRGPYSVDPSITEAGYPFLSYVPGEVSPFSILLSSLNFRSHCRFCWRFFSTFACFYCMLMGRGVIMLIIIIN
jgi:hypothetical protein